MSSVAQETLLAVDEAIQMGGHALDRGAQLSQFIPAFHGKCGREPAFRNLGGGTGHSRDVAIEATDKGEPAADRDHNDDATCRDPGLRIDIENVVIPGRSQHDPSTGFGPSATRAADGGRHRHPLAGGIRSRAQENQFVIILTVAAGSPFDDGFVPGQQAIPDRSRQGLPFTGNRRAPRVHQPEFHAIGGGVGRQQRIPGGRFGLGQLQCEQPARSKNSVVGGGQQERLEIQPVFQLHQNQESYTKQKQVDECNKENFGQQRQSEFHIVPLPAPTYCKPIPI